MTLEEHVNYIIEETKVNSKDAIKEVAKLRGLPKRDVYQAYHQ
jgi:16S rRNA (cytidine1402-2'-O)-methyltransferase